MSYSSVIVSLTIAVKSIDWIVTISIGCRVADFMEHR